MSRDILNNHEPAQTRAGQSTPNFDGFAQANAPTGDFAQEYLFGVRQLHGELRDCSSGIVLRRADVEGFVSLSQFSFNDARTLRVVEGEGGSVHPFLVLQAKIAAKVQELTSQSGTLCQSPEGEEAFIKRLEKQFNTIKATVVTTERQGCADKITGLCDQLDQVVDSLRSIPERSSHSADALERMASSLREYAHYSLGQPNIVVTIPHEGIPLRQELPVAAYFERLSSLIRAEFEASLDQAAA